MINRGSQWRRWEPHIHTPETVLNNQFGGEDPWEGYITTIESLSPTIEAIAVTDYYLTDNYQKFLEFKGAGRLPNVELVFPNIELRLDVAAKGGFVNVHLLVSPEDPNHIEEIQRILSRLRFNAHDDRFDCTRNDLIKLGKKSDKSITDDTAALKHGATQFKVNFGELRNVYHESDWAKKNILIAVAGGSSDGTSGVRQAADATVRQEIEKFAHIIFASSAAQREFWLGQRAESVETLRERYNGCKPCLHGSDSHTLESVGQPDDNRYSWIKGGLEFDSLRQACIDPEGRAFVGLEPPNSAMPSQVISKVSISDAPWAATPEIPLNSGLVAIIGARGSGKTALADVIAAGSDSIEPTIWLEENDNSSPSFLARAKQKINEDKVILNWGGGEETVRRLDGNDANNQFSYPRARYLSQQFVEELCSSNGVSDGLIREIERVVFEAHPLDDREGAVEFSEFREIKIERYKQARIREVEAISEISTRIASELEKEKQVNTLSNQVVKKDNSIKNYNSDLTKLVVKGTPEQVKRHAELSEAAQTLRGRIQIFSNQRRTFLSMQDEVNSTRSTKAPELLREAQERHRSSGLTDEQWEDFLLIYKGDVDKSLKGYMAWADQEIGKLQGKPLKVVDPNTPIIPDDADLATFDLESISAEMSRLEALFSADRVVRNQYTALTKKIAQENSQLKNLKDKLTDSQGAEKRRKELQAERDNTYKRIFDSILSEQDALSELYAPLMERVASSTGTLAKLSFHVQRIVDGERWAEYAEKNLLDLRKAGVFNGRGSLVKIVNETLAPVWENGTAEEIQSAMSDFISEHMKAFLEHAPFSREQQTEFKGWLHKFAQWLFGTDHISVRYEVKYDNTDIRKLSPGTRGIVLLLLFLALDEEDDRPLIIDQPEENLDPKSVNDELVPLFIAAKARRQVVMVTHNANLVINTDADQIITAEAGQHQPNGLPEISYTAGGLENENVRKSVCDILEGGETAFRERARRLRVRLER